MQRPLEGLAALILGAVLAGPAAADEGHAHGAEAKAEAQTSQPEAEIEALRAEVEELRAMIQALQPSVTRLMPNFAERFHVMHRAGEVGDWAVAAHELLGMRQIMADAKRVQPDMAPLFDAFMGQPFEDLEAAIEHADERAFSATLGQTIENCNACHKAVGSPFIEVVLDPPDRLSMRHPHGLHMSEPPAGHAHPPAGGQASTEDDMHEAREAGGSGGGHHHEEEEEEEEEAGEHGH